MPVPGDLFSEAITITDRCGLVDVTDFFYCTAEDDELHIFDDRVSKWYKFPNTSSQDKLLAINPELVQDCLDDEPKVYLFDNITYPLVVCPTSSDVDSTESIRTQNDVDTFHRWVVVPPGKTAWLQLVFDPSFDTPENTLARFNYVFGERYVIRAEDDINTGSTTASIVANQVVETQHSTFSGSILEGFPVNTTTHTDTFYVRGVALPPPGKYQIRFYGKNTGAMHIKRAGVVIGSSPLFDIYGSASMEWLQITYPNTGITYRYNLSGHDYQSIYFRGLPEFYVTTEDIAFCFYYGPTTIESVEFVYCGPANSPYGTFELGVGDEDWLGGGPLLANLDTPATFWPPNSDPYQWRNRSDLTPDVCVTDDGTLWVLANEYYTDGSTVRFDGPILRKWNGTSWTVYPTSLAIHSNAAWTSYTLQEKLKRLGAMSVATDGIDIWCSHIENEVGTAYDYRIHTQKFTVNTETFSVIGAPYYNGYGPGIYEYMPFTLLVSPIDGTDPSRPYLGLVAQSVAYGPRDPFFMKLNDAGTAWVDTNIPQPTFGFGPDIDSAWIEPGNYNLGVTMCHHDGLSTYPSIFYGTVKEDSPIEITEYVYSEYTGSGWDNTLRIRLSDYNSQLTYPIMITPNPAEDPSYESSTHQGLNMTNDGETPIVVIQIWESPSYRLYSGFAQNRAHNPHIVMKLNTDGLGFTPIPGDVNDVIYWGWAWGPVLLVDSDGSIIDTYAEGEDGGCAVVRHVPHVEQKWIADNQNNAYIGAYEGLAFQHNAIVHGTDIYLAMYFYDDGCYIYKIEKNQLANNSLGFTGLASMVWKQGDQ